MRLPSTALSAPVSVVAGTSTVQSPEMLTDGSLTTSMVWLNPVAGDLILIDLGVQVDIGAVVFA